MQDQQVGDASVLVEGQAEGRFGLAARLGMAIHTIDVPVNTINVTINTINMAVNTINSIGDGVSCKDKSALDKTLRQWINYAKLYVRVCLRECVCVC